MKNNPGTNRSGVGIYTGMLLSLALTLSGTILFLVNRNYDGDLEYTLIMAGFILLIPFTTAMLLRATGYHDSIPPQQEEEDTE